MIKSGPSDYVRSMRARLPPRCLPGPDEPVERGVQRNGNAELLRLADERARDQVDLRRAAGLDVLEHRRIVGAATPGGEDVHLPRILVERDSGGLRDPLALLDELVDEVAEIGRELPVGEVVVVRKAGEGRYRVDGGVEDQLRPLGGAQVGEGASPEARLHYE